MLAFDPRAYGPVFAPLLETDRRRPLDAGQPDAPTAAALKKLSIDSAFPQRPKDADMAACCIAGIWLLHDCLDESHTISQAIDTPSGSFWHAIMHRREGDFSNAKYWFRHVGQHPVYEQIGGHGHVAAQLSDNVSWDPFAFVDLCQAAVRGKSDARNLCLDIQQAEWELLFHHCFHAAIE